MKLEDVKDQIDEYFKNADPQKVIREFEEMGCEFEPITEVDEQFVSPTYFRGEAIQKAAEALRKQYWDDLAEAIKNELGESLVEEEAGEEDSYNWWLKDLTVGDIIDFLKKHKF
jgi:hypothetical protein